MTGEALAVAPTYTKLDGAISVLNGLVGDHLHERWRELSIAMELYHLGRPLTCGAVAVERSQPVRARKLCVLVHGLAENERVWSFPGEPDTTYGTLLARDLACTPLYVRYNTGLCISQNGEQLARLLEEVVAREPSKVREIVMLGHSMGGLVARSACHAAARDGLRWSRMTTYLFSIGSPHLGAPLEKLGNAVSWVLRTIGNSYTTRIADVLDLRSAGIKDLRYANLVALPSHIVQCALAGTMAADERHFVSWMFGDGLVRVSSASGRSEDEHGGPSTPHHLRIFGGLTHQRLAHDAGVYEQILAWCARGRL
jgi:pimeloyl-ACP methyl ester carboxylesterase